MIKNENDQLEDLSQEEKGVPVPVLVEKSKEFKGLISAPRPPVLDRRHYEKVLSSALQFCNDLRIGRSAIPEGSVWRGRKDAWFLASFTAGGVGCSRSF